MWSPLKEQIKADIFFKSQGR